MWSRGVERGLYHPLRGVGLECVPFGSVEVLVDQEHSRFLDESTYTLFVIDPEVAEA